MISLRLRILATWICFAVIAACLLLRVYPYVVVGFCLLVPSIRRFGPPPFPRAPRWFERLIYLLLVPAVSFFLIGIWGGYAEPWVQVAHVCLWVSLPLLFVLSARLDLKTWKAART